MDNLYYKKVIDDDKSRYRVTLSGLGSRFVTGGKLTGVLNSPIPFAGRNTFSSLKQEIEDIPLIGKIAKGLDKGAKVAKLFTGKTFQSELEQTRKVWQESQMPQLSLEMTFWGLKSGDVGRRPIDKMKAISSALFPSGSYDSYLVSAPLNYKWIEGKKLQASGTLTLSVGTWLAVSGLVMIDSNMTPSIETMRDGTPLYVTGHITLEPYRMLTYGEYLSWFKENQIHDIKDGKVTSDNAGSNVTDLGLVQA